MRILFDLGNTNIKIGLAGPGGLRNVYCLPSDMRSTPDLLGVQLLHFLTHAQIRPEQLACGLACSVVPGLNSLLTEACARYLGLSLKFAPEDVPIPLENRYARPAEVGADRLVGALAARELFPGSPALICVDFGTATTFDCVQDRVYLGGVICPGIFSSARALAAGTAKLPQLNLKVVTAKPSFGQDTATSLNHGFVFGFAALAEGMLARLKSQLSGKVTVVATGGFAEALGRVTDCFDAVKPDLLMDGLAVLSRGPRPEIP